MSSEIRFDNVSLNVDGIKILDGVSFEVGAGESVALIGRSGAGKTTLLRMVNGLAFPTGGRVLIDGEPTDEIDLVETRRRSGYIIQDSGLFPHRTVLENVTTMTRLKNWDESDAKRKAEELLESVGLPFDSYHDRFPRTLSGGERQRVGIVRAMIAEPDILLCDEPFGALDPIVRTELQQTLGRLRSDLGTTVLFVTHDLREARLVGDRVALIEEGRLVTITTPEEIDSLVDPVVQRFVDASTYDGGAASR